MDELRQIILYDSVNRHLWGLKLTHEMKKGYSTRVLGVSDGVLHYAMHNEAKVTVWCLKSDIRSQDAVWVKKYTTTLGVLSYLIHVIPVLAEVTSMEFHPDNPHILYFLVNGKFLSYDSENHNAELLYDIRKHTSKAGLFYLFFRMSGINGRVFSRLTNWQKSNSGVCLHLPQPRFYYITEK
ncbi:hypothetical protein P3L10_011961 [Capsicum annuum]